MFVAIQKRKEHTFHIQAVDIGDRIVTCCGILQQKNTYTSINLSYFTKNMCESCVSFFQSNLMSDSVINVGLGYLDPSLYETIEGFKINKSMSKTNKLIDLLSYRKVPPNHSIKNSKRYKKFVIKDFCKKARKCKV